MKTQKSLLVLIAPEDYEEHLAKEIDYLGGVVIERRGRVFLAEGLKSHPVFAQNVWLDPVWLDFVSVTDAAKKLRAIGGLWSLHSVAHHRRAELIEEKLPKIRKTPIQFGLIQKYPSLGAWTLWSPQRILASATTSSPFPDGKPRFVEKSELAPSKAYLKLWEWMTLTGHFPKAHERCLDLGSSPGGWTWVLANLGSQVVSVDKAPLDSRLTQFENIEWLKRDAFQLEPTEIGQVDWFFSDIICFPEKLLELVQKWRKASLAKNYVCTIKFKGQTDFEVLQKFRKIPGSQMMHLSVNRHEITWWLMGS